MSGKVPNEQELRTMKRTGLLDPGEDSLFVDLYWVILKKCPQWQFCVCECFYCKIIISLDPDRVRKFRMPLHV